MKSREKEIKNEINRERKKRMKSREKEWNQERKKE